MNREQRYWHSILTALDATPVTPSVAWARMIVGTEDHKWRNAIVELPPNTPLKEIEEKAVRALRKELQKTKTKIAFIKFQSMTYDELEVWAG